MGLFQSNLFSSLLPSFLFLSKLLIILPIKLYIKASFHASFTVCALFLTQLPPAVESHGAPL